MATIFADDIFMYFIDIIFLNFQIYSWNMSIRV